MKFDISGRKIFVAGHNGMVGSAVVRRLQQENVILVVAERQKLDLRDQATVRKFIDFERPDVVINAAAKIGGIHANDTQPVDFLFDNLAISTNLVDACHRADVGKLLLMGSSCIYPRLAAQPMVEEALLTGPLEPTNEWHAIAKIAGIKLCQAYRRQFGRDYISCQPTNLYGPNDNFDLANSHVLPALLRKAHEAKLAGAREMVVWGTGAPRREFLHVDDLADALIFLIKNYSDETPLNIGWGDDIAIREVAELVCNVVGFKGTLVFDTSKPDGAPRKLLDTSRLSTLGWKPHIRLAEGLKSYYSWFLENVGNVRS